VIYQNEYEKQLYDRPSAAILTERLIQAAVDYEAGRCSKREMAEARAAVEAAISTALGAK
jgi:hypothetical protein